MFAIIGPKIEKLRAMYKTNPRRFEIPSSNKALSNSDVLEPAYSDLG
jgi:hypothetical protein